MHAGVPCNTWSSARFLDCDKPGYPKPMRTRDFPYGGDPAYPLSRAEARKCEMHTKIFRRTIEILECASAGSRAIIGLENPKDPGVAPKPSIFVTSEVNRLRDVSGSKDFVFDQCMFTLDYKKPTQVLSNADLKDSLWKTSCQA